MSFRSNLSSCKNVEEEGKKKVEKIQRSGLALLKAAKKQVLSTLHKVIEEGETVYFGERSTVSVPLFWCVWRGQ